MGHQQLYWSHPGTGKSLGLAQPASLPLCSRAWSNRHRLILKYSFNMCCHFIKMIDRKIDR
uniref:Uncharacterized protein n=1 Tax=Naja naja TaxID=35670 RepID=A0A8C6VB53_NAJNA